MRPPSAADFLGVMIRATAEAMLGTRWRFGGLLPSGVFFEPGCCWHAGILGMRCCLWAVMLPPHPPPQAGTGGCEKRCCSPPIHKMRMSCLHPVSSSMSPGLWGKRGSQAGFGWAGGADPALGRGEEGAAPGPIYHPLVRGKVTSHIHQ